MSNKGKEIFILPPSPPCIEPGGGVYYPFYPPPHLLDVAVSDGPRLFFVANDLMKLILVYGRVDPGQYLGLTKYPIHKECRLPRCHENWISVLYRKIESVHEI